MDSEAIRADSEATIQSLGGRICEGLPRLKRTRPPRWSADAADRALAMHALVQVPLGAPVAVIERWLDDNDLGDALCDRERKLIAAGDAAVTDDDRVNLGWYVEALWALMWAGGLIPDLRIDRPVGDALASLLPDIKRNKSAEDFRQIYSLRPFPEILRMLDLYYRANWYARDGQLNGYDTEPFNLDLIMERRKALEWLADRSIRDWDDMPEDT